MEITDYSPADWADLCEVHDLARMQELAYAGLQAAFLPLSVAAEKEGLFEYCVITAKMDGKTIGFAAFTPDELAWLYVHPYFQRRGVGRKLAEFTLSHMVQGTKTVEVLAGNEPARKLYRGLGFAKEELVHGYMPGNEAFEVSVWQMTMEQV